MFAALPLPEKKKQEKETWNVGLGSMASKLLYIHKQNPAEDRKPYKCPLQGGGGGGREHPMIQYWIRIL